MVGEEGRGVPTIIEMVAMTRFDCMVGSSALMRQALTQASHHCAHRKVGGRVLSEQPLMQNVLADLALESEAALALSLRMGQALDHLDDPQQAHFARLVTAVGKYWICKRAPAMINEAAECMGGAGMSRTASCRGCTARRRSTRPGKAPATCSAWTCCGRCRKSRVLDALFIELGDGHGDKRLAAHRQPQRGVCRHRRHSVPRAATDRRHCRALQAKLLLEAGNAAVSDAFIASRGWRRRVYGALPRGWMSKPGRRDAGLGNIREQARPTMPSWERACPRKAQRRLSGVYLPGNAGKMAASQKTGS
jgi:putative acyl-CoA dehydrogenase